MRSFDETLQFVAELQACQNIDEVRQRLVDLTSIYGLDKVLVGTVPEEDAGPEDQKSHVLFRNWPDQWLDRYTTQSYANCDPLAKAIREGSRTILWKGSHGLPVLSERTQRMFDEASEFQMDEGLIIQLITLEGVPVFVSLAGEKMDMSGQEVGAMHLAATYAVTRAIQLSQFERTRQARPELTARERECIRWAAQGKSEWEISQILGISEHTSEKHLLSAKSKLGAVNRVQAVAEAIRLGYIT